MKNNMQQVHHAGEQPDRRDVLTKALIRTAIYLGVTNARLGRVLGLSPATISRLQGGAYSLSEKKKEWELAVLLVRLYRSLDAITGGSKEAAMAWLNSENKAFAGKRPIDLIESTEGLVRVVAYLDASRGIV